MIVQQTATGEWVDVTERVRAENAQLREALKRHGISYAQFARACGTSPSNISAKLSPHNEWPLPAYIWRIADDLGLTKGVVA